MELREELRKQERIAVCFSGGVDSSFLLYEAKQAVDQVCAYFVKTPFQPEFEYEDAKRLCQQMEVEIKVLNINILNCASVVSNPSNRCYFCKQQIMSAIWKQAAKDGFVYLADGTNASDDVCDRPGMKALMELQVDSPLRRCGLTKTEIRARSRAAGLFTWNKPAYACLATRIPTGMKITKDRLEKIERAENVMRNKGLSDFRVRMMTDTMAKIQIRQDQIEVFLNEREAIVCQLQPYFTELVLDLVHLRI